MIRVVLPAHLRQLASTGEEILVTVNGSVTQRSIIDAVEHDYPTLRGTIRDYASNNRRPFLRFFACCQDVSHESANKELPDEIKQGNEPFIILGAIAGG